MHCVLNMLHDTQASCACYDAAIYLELCKDQCLVCHTVVGASVYPLEACAPYAAPEVLDSILSRCHPSPDGFIRVNGAAADSWSVGIVMFEALTSDVPFKLRPYSLPQVPEYVTEKGAKTWQFIAGTRQHQQLWVSFLVHHHHGQINWEVCTQTAWTVSLSFPGGMLQHGSHSVSCGDAYLASLDHLASLDCSS